MSDAPRGPGVHTADRGRTYAVVSAAGIRAPRIAARHRGRESLPAAA